MSFLFVGALLFATIVDGDEFYTQKFVEQSLQKRSPWATISSTHGHSGQTELPAAGSGIKLRERIPNTNPPKSRTVEHKPDGAGFSKEDRIAMAWLSALEWNTGARLNEYNFIELFKTRPTSRQNFPVTGGVEWNYWTQQIQTQLK